LAIDKAVSDGLVGTAKTGVARTVPLPPSPAHDLDDYLGMASARRDSDLLFPGNGNQQPWSRSQANNWRARVSRPVLKEIWPTSPVLTDWPRPSPTTARGSFVSLHLRAGASPANVIEELVGEPRLSAEEQISPGP